MNIKEIRKSTGMSQAKFSEALNIPKRSLEKWETGERNCPVYVVELIAYRVQHDPIFKNTGKEERKNNGKHKEVSEVCENL